MKTGSWLVLAAVASTSTGCLGDFAGSGARPEGFRLVEGRLAIPEEDLLGRQVTGLQIAALAINATDAAAPAIEVYPSAIFDPGGARLEAAFVAPVDGEKSFVMVLQVPSGSGRGAGAFLGRLVFDDGRGGVDTLVPAGLDDVDLAQVAVQKGNPAPAQNTLRADSGNNPLSQVDTDEDGTVDLTDTDDDDDGTPDQSDADAGGDGVDDVFQRLEALPDSDADGIPDALAG